MSDLEKELTIPPFEFCRTRCLGNDPGYDGLFYSCVSTTKIYCRTVCPGVSPHEKNNVFNDSRARAEGAGFRPCLRCRPETAPLPPLLEDRFWQLNNDMGNLLQGRINKILRLPNPIEGKKNKNKPSIDFSLTTGVSPRSFWKTFQLGFAKMLLTDTQLPPRDIAGISRFKSAGTMMDQLKALYGREPVKKRRPLPVEMPTSDQSCSLRLHYRPPFDWDRLLTHFSGRMIIGTESVTQTKYSRTFSLNGCRGWFSVYNESRINALRLDIHATDLDCLMPLVWRVRKMFDLNADPNRIKQVFKNDALLAKAFSRHSGVRVPTCWDPCEAGVRAVAGQLISVKAAIKIVTNVADTLGSPLPIDGPKELRTIFPEAPSLSDIKATSCGLTRTKETAIANFSRAVAEGTIDFNGITSLDLFFKQLKKIKGIGEWTAQNILMRGVGAKDVFPAMDLGISQAFSRYLKIDDSKEIKKTALRWQPLSAYAATLLWEMRGNKENK